ncbi:MAG: hypothetical protein WAW69_14775 [Polaromonas sp.]
MKFNFSSTALALRPLRLCFDWTASKPAEVFDEGLKNPVLFFFLQPAAPRIARAVPPRTRRPLNCYQLNS